jgi:hypothetical protein
VTIVTLEELFSNSKPLVLTVPEHPAAELGERYGYYEDTVNGRRHYVTKDDKDRAVVGPVRHRARGLLGLGRKRRKPQEQPERLERIITTEDITEHMELVAAELGNVMADMPTIRFNVPTPPAPPQAKPGLLTRLRAKFYDHDWHVGARDTAATVLMFSFTAASIIVAAKAVYWVVTL